MKKKKNKLHKIWREDDVESYVDDSTINIQLIILVVLLLVIGIRIYMVFNR
ncbi:hypothetical protein [Inconstantimicrobium mannanitabidum]|uniref:Uncharacterized protein n=1 Tax=Inconstantimicrobium mannanitabidum TaxID=1604901 RepID=A0ACB5R7B8_9CLOT|nr:hypothetical protein [Clostridium sp. TW13]GKX64903.1 hypothetical protein rsdtw13_01610 [Clostridium sp. TW13]